MSNPMPSPHEPGTVLSVVFDDHVAGGDAGDGPVRCRAVGIVSDKSTAEWLVLDTFVNADPDEERGRDDRESIGIVVDAIRSTTRLTLSTSVASSC